MPKRTKIKFIIYAVLFVLATITLVWWFVFNSTRVRDYQRLGDMRVLEAEMNAYFFKFNTYKIPECTSGSVLNFCTGRGDNTISVGNLVDPISSENLRYIVTEMSDNGFRVEFYLEGGLLELQKGKYALTRDGLGR
jgi:hypothetical protein